MHFRNNHTDFWNWCRHYVRRAKSIIRVHDNSDNTCFRIRNKKTYEKAYEIINQYELLKLSLNDEQNDFLENSLINNVKPRKYNFKTFNNIDAIQYNWQKICFPEHKPKIKTLDKVKVGYMLKQERLFQGWSVKFVAELINISEATLKSYEEGRRLVRLDVVYQLSQIYDINIDYLINERNLNIFKTLY